jgi:hypothetical protein
MKRRKRSAPPFRLRRAPPENVRRPTSASKEMIALLRQCGRSSDVFIRLIGRVDAGPDG